MKVFNLQVNCCALRDISLEDVQSCLSKFIDSSLDISEAMEKHYHYQYKDYCFSGIFVGNGAKKVNELELYSFRIRTINENIKNLLVSNLSKHRTKYFQGISCVATEMTNKDINELISISPLVIKNPNVGYWRGSLSLDDFIKRITDNCFKKAKYFGIEVDEKIPLFTGIEIINSKPIATKYKNIKLLGDKVKLTIADHEQSKLIAYLLLGVGLGENTSRGFGFVKYIR